MVVAASPIFILVVSALASCATILTTLAGIYLTYTKAQSKIQEIHVLVNSRLSEALSRVEQLQSSLGITDSDPAPPPRSMMVDPED